MRFMVMHKMNEELERGAPPDAEIIAGVDALIKESLQTQAFLSGEGLKPTAQRTHLVYRGGERTTTDGPFTDVTEQIGDYALLRVRSKDEALAACDKLAAATGDTEIMLGPVVEPWDLGMMPEPKHAPLRFLALAKIDARAEAEEAPDAAVTAKQQAARDELKKAGVLQGAGRLASTKRGARIRKKGGRHTVLDGPFAESKELIAGYALMELPSKEAAVEWGKRFFDVVRVDEVDVRLVED